MQGNANSVSNLLFVFPFCMEIRINNLQLSGIELNYYNYDKSDDILSWEKSTFLYYSNKLRKI